MLTLAANKNFLRCSLIVQLNHMSGKFQGVMRDISALFKEVYQAVAVTLIPGCGTCALKLRPTNLQILKML